MTTTEHMIKALRAYAAKHKHDIVSTDAVDVSEMCFDAADRLEELAKGKHGHWIEGCPTETTDYFNCSVCNAGIFVNNLWRVSYEDVSEIHRYCHNCGAKMDEKEDSNHDD